MLHQISEALQQRVEISIVPTETTLPQSLSLLDNLPARLIEARKAMGMTPKELGAKVGMSEQEIEDHEVSFYASISFDRLRKIVEVLAIQTYA
jgi:ribosome-binding protein aMBF1 (putative translation factor)